MQTPMRARPGRAHSRGPDEVEWQGDGDEGRPPARPKTPREVAAGAKAGANEAPKKGGILGMLAKLTGG